jgi:hypothetical protein
MFYDARSLVRRSSVTSVVGLPTEIGNSPMSHKTLIVCALFGALSCLSPQAMAQDSKSVHEGEWPIENGVKHQPTGNGQDVTPDQAREIDRLYDELLSSGDKTQPRVKRAR